MSEIRWEEPPPHVRGGGAEAKWPKRLSPLLDHPKRWAVVYESENSARAYSMSSALRSSIALPVGTTRDQWEFVARTTGGKGCVYARYLGDGA